MKTFIYASLIFISAILFSNESSGQWRANLYGGYGFDDDISAQASGGSFFSGTVKGTAYYGGGIEYVLQTNYGIELLYMREDTEVPISYTTNAALNDTAISPGLGMNFIMVSGNGYTRIPNSVFELFGSVMLGMAIFENKNPLQGAESSSTKFGYGFRAGTNIWVSPTFGLKINGQLLSAAQAYGGGFYVGTGGVSPGLSTESSMLQFGIGGGITFKFK